MATITVKNVPDDLYERLKQLAEANRRSINSEVIVCIEHAVGSYEVNPDDVIRAARALREKTAHYVVSDEELREARAKGRP